RLASLLAHHGAASAQRDAGHRAAAPRHQSQQLHDPLHHDRRRTCGRIGNLDHPHLSDRVRAHPLRARVGLFGDPVHRHDDDGILLYPRVDARRREGAQMSGAPVEIPAGRRLRRRDPWVMAGAVLLVLLTMFAVMPMAWMLVTSIKTQFAATQYPPEW